MMNTDTFPDANGASLASLTASMREQIQEAQHLLEAGDVKGAEARAKALSQLIRALEAQIRLEAEQSSEQMKGVFYDSQAIADARAELTRRFDRLAKTLSPREMGREAE